MTEQMPYLKTKSILSKNEMIFYRNLKPIANKLNMEIFTKVRLADIAYANKYQKGWQTWFNRVKSKHIDFLLCDNFFLMPMLAIEIDDITHDQPDRIERDIFICEVLKTIKLPVFRTRTTANLESTILQILRYNNIIV